MSERRAGMVRRGQYRGNIQRGPRVIIRDPFCSRSSQGNRGVLSRISEEDEQEDAFDFARARGFGKKRSTTFSGPRLTKKRRVEKDTVVPDASSHGSGLWKKLLFSQKASDLKFKFPDGTVVNAHKCVLVTASPYFDAALDGPWSTSHPDGVWKTTNSLAVMKAILCFIYTSDEGQIQALTILELGETASLAVEYQLPVLKTVVVRELEGNLSKETLKYMLPFSHVHGLSDLKKDCFDMVHNNPLWAMFNPSIMDIAREHPELWKEMSDALKP